ncbi:MAG TPA: THUMP domain-containing protein [Candidatus Thermoplasmatota archaeon]|nr:THUMP domain-containing protein [Candidatus Thermoplasmatota archaeon]
MASTLLVRYGEIGIKGPAVRARFERRLVENMESMFAARGLECATEREWGRVFVHTAKPAEALDALAHTFGVVSASEALECEGTVEAVAAFASERTTVPAGATFAVRARRAGTHGFSSVDVARATGAAIVARNPGARVDLENPDVEVFVEVRGRRAYVYRDAVAGPGGLPLGTQGRVAILLDEPRDVLAAWLLMKRGVSPQILAASPVEGALRPALEALAAWTPALDLGVLAVPEAWSADPARRRAFLVEALARHASHRRATAVVLGDGLAEAAAFAPLDARVGRPVFRPLVGYPGERLAALARVARLEPALGPAARGAPAAPVADVPAPSEDEVKQALMAVRRATITRPPRLGAPA